MAEQKNTAHTGLYWVVENDEVDAVDKKYSPIFVAWIDIVSRHVVLIIKQKDITKNTMKHICDAENKGQWYTSDWLVHDGQLLKMIAESNCSVKARCQK